MPLRPAPRLEDARDVPGNTGMPAGAVAARTVAMPGESARRPQARLRTPPFPLREVRRAGHTAGLAGSKFGADVSVFASSKFLGQRDCANCPLPLRVWHSTTRRSAARVTA